MPVAALQEVAALRPCHPPVDALRVSQDRVLEKQLFGRARHPDAAVPHRRLPRRSRGRGRRGRPARRAQDAPPRLRRSRPARAQRRADVAPAWEALGSVPLILEGFVAFDREVSIVGARGTNGETRAYPLVAQHASRGHPAGDRGAAPRRAAAARGRGPPAPRHGPLRLRRRAHARVLRRARAGWSPTRWRRACTTPGTGPSRARSPRSSRTTCAPSRGLPLGDTSAVGHSAMVNFIGTLPDRARVLAVPGAHHHDYGKAPRPGRKLGHVTLVARSGAERDLLLAEAAAPRAALTRPAHGPPAARTVTDRVVVPRGVPRIVPAGALPACTSNTSSSRNCRSG